ncbi:DNA alkylation repair protein [Candidatus Gottesmanbacteria bacterium]|nr:DNA alkylation repair protein [Candidatus Gottesmanbacteria bacterium]
MNTSPSAVKKELRKLQHPKKARILQRFFKTGPGEYGEGDIFLGISVPQIRNTAKKYFHLDLITLTSLIRSSIHEERQLALMILVAQFKKGDEKEKKRLYTFYLDNIHSINNWDLIDGSAEHIIGSYLESKNKTLLKNFASSDNLWKKRIAMVSTFYYIKQGDPKEALKIATILIKDRHDLIQKAVGWMLREIGKRCGEDIEEAFLKKYYKAMPRTMLRYAIEHFSNSKREFYLAKKNGSMRKSPSLAIIE